MSLGNLIEVIIILFIAGGLYAVWRVGANNPVGTRKLEKSIDGLSNTVGGLKKRVDKLEQTTASHADVQRLKEMITEQDEKVQAIVSQLPDIRDKQNIMAENVAALTALSNATARQVEMIYQVIVPKGMK